MSIMMNPRYIEREPIGQGAYGTVYKAVDDIDKKVVALKEARFEGSQGLPSAFLRETSILSRLNHPNVVTQIEVFNENLSCFQVLELMAWDLNAYILSREFIIPANTVNAFMKQILQGLEYCHSRQIIHRDLKPQNILLGHQGQLKLADFGLARQTGLMDMEMQRQYTPNVVTLPYRAPELLIEATYYSTPVDIWSVGCIFAELVTLEPLFPGRTEIDELCQIFRVLGTPTEAEWRAITRLLPGPPACNPIAEAYEPQNLATVVPGLDADGLDLLRRMLKYNPAERISAEDALTHPYFN